jgi:DnaK suppressor protein
VTEAKKIEQNKKFEIIKKKLLERKEELEEGLSDLYRAKAPAPDQIQDIGDHAQSLSQETLMISLQDTEIQEYNMILQALKMIEEGTYGNCTDCGQPISEKRLHLYPNATRCLVCQEIVEDRKQERL